MSMSHWDVSCDANLDTVQSPAALIISQNNNYDLTKHLHIDRLL